MPFCLEDYLGGGSEGDSLGGAGCLTAVGLFLMRYLLWRVFFFLFCVYLVRGHAPETMGDNLPEVDLGTGRTAVSIRAGGERTCAILDDGSLKV